MLRMREGGRRFAWWRSSAWGVVCQTDGVLLKLVAHGRKLRGPSMASIVWGPLWVGDVGYPRVRCASVCAQRMQRC